MPSFNQYLDLEQVGSYDTDLSNIISGDANLKEIMKGLNQTVQVPFKITRSGPSEFTVDSGVVFNDKTATNISVAPISEMAYNLPGTTITIPATNTGNVSAASGGSLTLTATDFPNDSFVRMGIGYKDDGELKFSLGTPNADRTLATKPVPPANTIPLGEVLLKTTGANIDAIPVSGLIAGEAVITMYRGAGGGGSGGGGLTLRYINANTLAEPGSHYLADSSGGPITLTLPPVSAGAKVALSDALRVFGVNNVTIQPDAADGINGGAAGDTLIVDLSKAWLQLSADPANNNWVLDTQMVAGAGNGAGRLVVNTDANYTLSDGEYLQADTTNNPIEVQLPPGQSGFVSEIIDPKGTWGLNSMTLRPPAGGQILGTDNVDDTLEFDLDWAITTISWDVISGKYAVTRPIVVGSLDPLPLGVIMAVDDRYNTVTLPAPGVISPEGFALCDGQALSGLVGHQLGNNISNLPDLTDGRFLRGFATSGGTGGQNDVSLSTANMPSHTHGPGNFSTSLNISGSAPSLTGTTTFAGAGHTHGNGSYVAAIYELSSQVRMNRVNAGFVVPTNIAFNTSGGFVASNNDSLGSKVMGTSSGNSFNRSVGITGGSYGLTGSNSVTGTSGSAGSGSSFDIKPVFFDVRYIIKVKGV